MKHTPGPWYPLCESSDLEGNNWQFTIGSEPRLNNYGGQVATVGWKDLTREQTEANARLIAAAPELLEALKALTNTARTFRNVPKDEQEWTPIDDEALATALAAIAKAEGKG